MRAKKILTAATLTFSCVLCTKPAKELEFSAPLASPPTTFWVPISLLTLKKL